MVSKTKARTETNWSCRRFRQFHSDREQSALGLEVAVNKGQSLRIQNVKRDRGAAEPMWGVDKNRKPSWGGWTPVKTST